MTVVALPLPVKPRPHVGTELIERVELHGRTFVIRRHANGKFPFEVSEQLRGGHLIAHESYRLFELARMDLQRRVREVEALAARYAAMDLRPTHDGYDAERADRFRMENLPDTYGRYGSDS